MESNHAEVRTQLLKVLAGMDKQCEYAPNADIFEDFGLDSLDQIEFLYNVEATFGVKIEEEAFEQHELRNFDRLVAYLAERHE